ncbi:MAG: hypothetical protein V2A59_00180 [Candidatus Omnitrophota bacterium]
MIRFTKRGVVLVLLLGTILLVTSLAGIASYIVLNQSRVGQHQVNRIKAYYACMAGITLALEKLRTASWGTASDPPYALCRDSSSCSGALDYEEDWDIPYRVNITITAPDANGIRTINATTDYTYTP